MYVLKEVMEYDPEIAKVIENETNRQKENIELIASENIVSKAVIAAMGTTLTNKYAEGYPARRYYGGCECVDEAELIAIERAKKLFGAEHANVQPHSGAQANFAVFYGFLSPGDTVLGMDLSQGGHLSHGSPVNVSGSHYNVVSYGVNEKDGRINYDKMRELALKHRPKMIIAGASAYSREIDFRIFADTAKEAGAYLMADIAHIAGLVATGYHISPIPYADFVTSTTHKTLRGPRGGLILCKNEHAAKIDKAVFPGTQGGPLMHTIAAKAVAFKEALEPSFKQYIGQVVKNADALSRALINKGLDIVSGGTDNHLMLADLRKMNMTGKEMEQKLDEINITCNKNSIPFDPEKPFVTSGIRLGTPAVTSRGMVEADMAEIADLIYLAATDFCGNENAYRQRVAELTAKYPIY